MAVGVRYAHRTNPNTNPYLGLGFSLRLQDERVHELADPVAGGEVRGDDDLLVRVFEADDVVCEARGRPASKQASKASKQRKQREGENDASRKEGHGTDQGTVLGRPDHPTTE